MKKAELVEHLLREHAEDLPFSDQGSLSTWLAADLRSLHLSNHQLIRVRSAPPPAKTRADLEPGQYAYEIELLVHDPEWPGTYKFNFVTERRLLEMGAMSAFMPLMLQEVFGTTNPVGLPHWGIGDIEEYGSEADQSAQLTTGEP
jgi:hypothetical protein